jgi:hypothetical protein
MDGFTIYQFLNYGEKSLLEIRKIVATTITLISIAPALWFGWTSFSYLVMGLGALTGAIGAGLIWLLPPVSRPSENQRGFISSI